MGIEIELEYNPPEFMMTLLDWSFETEAQIEKDQKIEAIINIEFTKGEQGE